MNELRCASDTRSCEGRDHSQTADRDEPARRAQQQFACRSGDKESGSDSDGVESRSRERESARVRNES